MEILYEQKFPDTKSKKGSRKRKPPRPNSQTHYNVSPVGGCALFPSNLFLYCCLK